MNTSKSNIYLSAGKIQFFFVLSILVLFSACRSTDFIEDNQALVREADIKFEGDYSNDEIGVLDDELYQLVQQPPPKRSFFVPRDYFDLKNQNPSDTSWYKKFVRRFFAQEHQIFDSTKVESSAFEMQRYLQNKKGFYDAQVTSTYEVKSKIAKTKFTVDLGKQFTVNEIHYRSNMPEIQSILDEIEEDALIKVGTAIDASIFDSEKERIFQVLQNRGYANFLSNNIKIKGDSSDVDKQIDILFDLNASKESRTFVKYEIGQINVFTDYLQDGNYPSIPAKVINGKNYYSLSKNFVIKPRSIDKQIFIKSGKDYNRSQYYQTIKKLSELSTYKFVKLSPSYDTKNEELINYDIYLTPYQTKYLTDIGTGSFFSTTNTNQGQRLIGFSADGSLINRNAFGGSEKNELIGEVGLEFQVDPRRMNGILRQNAITFGLSNVTTVPNQVDYLGLIGLGYSLFNIPTTKQEKYEVATNTNFTVGWNYQSVINLYTINSFAAGVSYNYEPGNNWSISYNPTGLNFIAYNYTIGSVWDQILQDSPLLLNSFKSTILSGILFKEVNVAYTKPENKNGFSWSLFGGFQLSGAEVHIANSLFNLLPNQNELFKISDIEFAKFGKLQLEWRYLKKLNETSNLAGRLNFGIAKPYADNVAVPYVQQFFVGGQNSMRAWQARELGPGGYSEKLLNPTVGERFFQTGDMIIEANLEYRGDLFWWIDYALFMDVGNVWTLEEDPGRPGAKFSNLYEQMAMAWGWGLRFDFTYFILRFDFAYRLKNPYLLDAGSPIETYFESPIGQGVGSPQIGINYPF